MPAEKPWSPLLLTSQKLQGSPNAEGNAACAFLLARFARDHLLLGGTDRQKRKSGVRFCKEPGCRSPRDWILAQAHRGRVMQKADLGEFSPQMVHGLRGSTHDGDLLARLDYARKQRCGKVAARHYG